MNASRCGATLGLLLLLVSTVGMRPVAAQGGNGTGVLRIRSWICPEGYTGTDLRTACTRQDTYRRFHGYAEYAGTEVSNSTEMSGIAYFGNLTPDRYHITGGVPEAYLNSVVIDCGPSSDPNVPFHFVQDAMRTLTIAIGAGEDVLCDWWNLVHTDPPPLDYRLVSSQVESALTSAPGEAGSVVFHGRLCPYGYEGSDRIGVCTVAGGSNGLAFGLRHGRSEETDEYLSAGFRRGEMSFTNLPPGHIGVGSNPGIALDFIGYRIECYDVGSGAAIPVDDTGNGFSFELAPGQNLECYFFTWPEHLMPALDNRAYAGSLTIYAAWCPAGYDGADYFGDCYATPATGVLFTSLDLVADSPGPTTDFRSATGDEFGFASFPQLNGTYQIRLLEPGAVHVGCVKDGERVATLDSPDGEITLDITNADDLRCDWYIVPAA